MNLKNEIFLQALALAKKIGYDKIKRHNIAKLAGCSPSLIRFHFKKMEKLKYEIVKYAIINKLEKIVVHAYILKDPIIKKYKARLAKWDEIKIKLF